VVKQDSRRIDPEAGTFLPSVLGTSKQACHDLLSSGLNLILDTGLVCHLFELARLSVPPQVQFELC